MTHLNLLFTIITPSFNQGEFIEATILSVLNQTYKNIQYIIVDGGSTDNTMDIVNKYRDSIDIIVHEKDKGQSDAINKGFKLSKGDLIGWINSDDILYPTCVENIIKLYQKHPNASILYNCNNRRINEYGQTLGEYTIKIQNKIDLLNNNYSIIQQGSFYSAKALKQTNLINESLNYCMDLDLWFQLLNFGSIHYSDEAPQSAFRVYSTTKTATGGAAFLSEIRKTLIKNGANFIYSKALRQTYWYALKVTIKKMIQIK